MSLFTPRVSPDALRGGPPSPGGNPGPSGPVLVADGDVVFDLAVPADAAIVLAGGSKPVVWWSGIPTNVIVPGPLSAFAIYLESVAVTASVPPAAQLYDLCAEARLTSGNIVGVSNDIATAWVWDALTAGHPFAAVVPAASPGLFIGYEGSPVNPMLLLRSGMITAVTDPTQRVKFSFKLYMLPTAAFGASRVHVPSPWSAPPFMPFGASMGTHLFSQHATLPTPLGQAANVRRMFRPLTWRTDGPAPVHPAPVLVVDARLFGGPWNAHVLGVKPTADPVGSTWDIEELLRSGSIPWAYSPPVLATANNAASIYTPRPVDALRVTLNAAEGTHPRTDLLLTFPE